MARFSPIKFAKILEGGGTHFREGWRKNQGTCGTQPKEKQRVGEHGEPVA